MPSENHPESVGRSAIQPTAPTLLFSIHKGTVRFLRFSLFLLFAIIERKNCFSPSMRGVQAEA
jgi:hypothetical protein